MSRLVQCRGAQGSSKTCPFRVAVAKWMCATVVESVMIELVAERGDGESDGSSRERRARAFDESSSGQGYRPGDGGPEKSARHGVSLSIACRGLAWSTGFGASQAPNGYFRSRMFLAST